MSRTKRAGQLITTKDSLTGNADLDMQASYRQVIALQANNIMRTMLAQRGKGGIHGKRDIDCACGYKKDLVFDDFWSLYDRDGVAARCVECYPDYTWIQKPKVYEREDSTLTKFEKDWAAHVKECNPFAELHKLDIQAGIGTFGLLVMGVDDGKKLHEPLLPSRERRTVVYYRSYTEGEVKITQYDNDTSSIRFGQPVMYQVTPGIYSGQESVRVTPATLNGETGTVESEPFAGSFDVHYSRCLHFADNALCGNLKGVPRLRRVFNRMSDILKVVGGSAEMFWQGAFSGIAFEMEADAEVSDTDKMKMREDINNYINDIQRTILLQGVKANPLSPTIASPVEHLDVQITLICISERIPKRIFMGSENGKQASSQDSENWGQQIKTRRTNVANPALLEPYIKFCIRNGIVRPPVGGINAFITEWPEYILESNTDNATAADRFTTALETYCSKSLYHAMAFADYLVFVWKYSDDEAKTLAKKFNTAKFEKIREESLKAKETAATSEQSSKTVADKNKSSTKATTKKGSTT